MKNKIFLLLMIATQMACVTKEVSNYVYALPYEKGTKHKVVQGYGGVFSHRKSASIDFKMPVGTPILASRGGVVMETKDSAYGHSISGKYNDSANYIMIRHSDSTLGCYWHIKNKGVLVKVGHKVNEGELIGYSGNTGQTLKPHLHFSVKTDTCGTVDCFRKTKFKTEKGVKFLRFLRKY
jgi:murein DD-endopeptidase MepM/ murein hydrolase activator NlpD